MNAVMTYQEDRTTTKAIARGTTALFRAQGI
jgi:hypothetical protein